MQENTFPSVGTKIGTPNYALIGGLIGLTIIMLGAWYMMKSNVTSTAVPIAPPISEITTTPNNAASGSTTGATPDTATAALKVQGKSDEINAIDADLKATDMSSFNDINKI